MGLGSVEATGAVVAEMLDLGALESLGGPSLESFADFDSLGSLCSRVFATEMAY